LRPSSINTMFHGVRGFFRFAHIDGLIPSDPAVYARLPKVHQDESRPQGLDRLELIRFLQVAQTITVHHDALAYLLGINALRASEAAAVRIEDYRETLRGHRACTWLAKATNPPPCPLTVPVLRVLEACRGERTQGPLVLRPLSGQRSTDATATGWSPGSPKPPGSRATSAHTPCGMRPSPTPWTQACRCAMPRSWPGMTPAPPSTTTAPAATSTATAFTSSPPTSRACELLSQRVAAFFALSPASHRHDPL
jgi:integrase/recombinase XerD